MSRLVVPIGSHTEPIAEIRIGDCIKQLQMLEAKSVHCCVTSPPYFGLRDYGVNGQIGLEETPAEFIQRLVEVFREVRRVLRDDGTCWVNMGDSYAALGHQRLLTAWRDGAAQMDILLDGGTAA